MTPRRRRRHVGSDDFPHSSLPTTLRFATAAKIAGMDEKKQTFCRICAGFCGLEATVREGRVIEVRGDRNDSQTRGYACIKGLQAPHVHHGPSRLLHPLKRLPDGSFKRIPLEQALDEIATRLSAILRDF